MAGTGRRPCWSAMPAKNFWKNVVQATSTSGGPMVAISQSSTSGRFEVSVDDVPGPAVAPIQHAPVVGRHRLRDELDATLEDRDRVLAARPGVVRAEVGDLAGQRRRRPARRGAGTRCRRRRRDVVEPDEDVDRRALEPLPLLRCPLQEPARPDRAGRAGCRTATTPSTARVTRNGTRSHSAEVSRWTTSGTGTVVRARTRSITRRWNSRS